jgi:Mrp family chromosome partitioning ATPase
MSVIAMIGFMLGAFGASGWAIAADRLSPDGTRPQPADPRSRSTAPEQKAPAEPQRREAFAAPIDKPVIARLQDSDVIRTLGGILGNGASADVTRFGWPTLRPGFPLTTFLNALRDIRGAVGRRLPDQAVPVIAIIGEGTERSVVALNFALAAARDGADVLVIDADAEAHKLSDKLARSGETQPSRLGWLSIGSKASRAVKTENGISILPTVNTSGKMTDAIRTSIAQARSSRGYNLVILDGPALPWQAADHKLLGIADGIVAVLPVSLDLNDDMEEIITSLGDAQRKLAGVILDELTPPSPARQRSRQYA